ncbi:MAG: efflux RND transporter periplasmic adaptor subunit [Gammaproteobacteria bacterium]
MTIEPQRTVLTVDLPGRTRPLAVSEVRPQVSGILKQRLFEEGSRVEAGQPLYQIDDTLYRASVDSAEAQLQNARAALATAKLRAERYASLRQEKSISQQDYDDAQTALEQARATVAQQEASLAMARINLGYTRITAPIEDINESSTDHASLRKAADNGRGSADGITARVTLTLDDGTPYPHEGTLQFSEVVVDPTTGSVTLRAEFPNPEAMLLPGMFVRATIVTGVVSDALLVPQRGISRDGRGNATALIVDDDSVVRLRTLAVRQTVASSWLVTAGIEPGDRVIVEGLQFVRVGQAVNALPFQGDAQAALGAQTTN